MRVLRDEGWRDLLFTRTVRGRKGQPDRYFVLPNLANVVTLLTEHPDMRGLLAKDLFAERVITTRPPPWHASDAPAENLAGELTDTDVARFVLWLYRTEELSVSDRVVAQAIAIVAEKNQIHPVRDWLRSLKWDGKIRLPEAASAYMGSDSTDYTRAIIPRWFVSAVARVMVPGAQCDCVLILEGKTGWKKSSFFRALVPVREWYADSGITIGAKDSYQNIHGVWIYGFDELDSLSKSELTATKNFITQTFDRFRPPFGKVPRNFQRQNVFAGSTNKDDYLNDPTGDRRYWPIRIFRPIDVDAVVRDRDMLWAEAVARYDSNEKWHVDTPELRRMCEAEQSKRSADDAWAPIVADWLKAPTVPDPEERSVRRPIAIAGVGVTTTDVLLGALNMKAADITRPDEMRAGVVLRQLGLTFVIRDPDGARTRRYRKPSDLERELDEEGSPSQVPVPTS